MLENAEIEVVVIIAEFTVDEVEVSIDEVGLDDEVVTIKNRI